MPERLDDLAASFRRDLRAAGKADRTIIIYRQAIRFFCDWLAARDRPLTTDSLTKGALAAWFEDLHEAHQPGTVLTRYKGMRRFVRLAARRG